MKKIFLILIASFCSTSFLFGQTYTGQFYAPLSIGMYTDSYFNLHPQSGATAANTWNIYHTDGSSSLFSVAFGATIPSIQVGASRTTNFYVNGLAGIGTSAPDGLQINSPLSQESTRGVNNVRIGVLGGTPRIILDSGGSTPYEIDNNAGQMRFFTPGLVRMVLNSNGYVGIGTSSPDALLAVSGQVHAQEVKVSITVPGPDYVFEKDYKLTSLEEIKNYINQNKHLPEVPSAKEMEKNGVQLGEMNMLLLKKIEELTLYVIEQNKSINHLKIENEVLHELATEIKKLHEEIKAIKNENSQIK